MSTRGSEEQRYPIRPAAEATEDPHPCWQSGSWFRLFVPSFVHVFLACALAFAFLGDTFVIYTSSMEPTLVGHTGGGDRILQSHLHYLFGRPERFDIISFTYPNNRGVTFMKRILGLGGEQVFIAGGNVYLADRNYFGTLVQGLRDGQVTILRKPDRVREAILENFPVLFPEECRDFERTLPLLFTTPKDEQGAWTAREEYLTVEATEPRLLATRKEIKDDLYDFGARTDEGLPPLTAAASRYPVGELSWRVAARPRNRDGVAILAIDDAAHSRRTQVEVAVRGGGRRTRLFFGGIEIGSSDAAIEPGRFTDLRLDVIDDRIRLEVGGREVLVRDVFHEPPADDKKARWNRAAASLGAKEGVFDLKPLALYRDIYYTQEGPSRFLIPERNFLVLGDHSAQSSDSRRWRRTAIEVKRSGEILEGDDHGVTSKDTFPHDRNPWIEPDGSLLFIDVDGKLHGFESMQEFNELGTWPTPYVPEDFVLGRAILVMNVPTKFQALR